MPQPPLWIRTKSGLAFDDIPERSGGRMPDFCIIGAAKAGTTSLDNYLDQHPDIFMCPLKEPHYFSTEAIFDKGAQWYRGLYADAAADQKCGEASTSYTRYPSTADTPRQLYEANPEMRLIYILREPVKRIESECLQAMKFARYVAGDNDMPGNVDAILDYLSGDGRDLATFPIESSDYVMQIDQYLSVFPRNQLLVILMDDLIGNPRETFAQLFHHIGVDPAFQPDQTKRLNRTDDFVEGLRNEQTISQLGGFPGVTALKALLPQTIRNLIRSWIAKPAPAENFELSKARKAALKAHFKDRNRRLAAFLGRDLSPWDT